MDPDRLGASRSLLFGWFDGFAAHPDQTACGLINRITTLEAIGRCNTRFLDEAPKNVFANCRETRVIHQLIGTLACTFALVWAVVQRTEKGLFLQRFQYTLAGPRHIGRSGLKGCCQGKEQQCSTWKRHIHGPILP